MLIGELVLEWGRWRWWWWW